MWPWSSPTFPGGTLAASSTCPSTRPATSIKALRLLNGSGYPKQVRNLAVSVYDLIETTDEQLELFASPQHKVSEAMDEINDKYGDFMITPALIMGMQEIYTD